MENLFLASIEIGTFARTGDERAIKGRRNRQEYYLGYHRHHLLVLIPFLSPSPSTLLWREREGKKKESSDGAVVVGQRRYSKCERMQISSLMSGIFKEAERWMEHAAGTGQYDDICIWYIIQSPFLPPTTAACAAHKPPCRSHEIRLPGKSPFFLSLSFYTSSHTFDSDEILLFLYTNTSYEFFLSLAFLITPFVASWRRSLDHFSRSNFFRFFYLVIVIEKHNICSIWGEKSISSTWDNPSV